MILHIKIVWILGDIHFLNSNFLENIYSFHSKELRDRPTELSIIGSHNFFKFFHAKQLLFSQESELRIGVHILFSNAVDIDI